MGKSETASSSLGYKIKVSALVEQLNEKNKNQILDYIENGFIEDENDGFNTSLFNMLSDLDLEELREKEPQEIIETLKEHFTNNGNIIELRVGGTLHDKSITLYESYLLIELNGILDNTRWGYDRYGINGSSMSFETLLEIVSEFKQTESNKENCVSGLELVFIVKQESG